MPWCFRSVFPIPKWLFFLANTALEKLWIWLPKTCLSLHNRVKNGGHKFNTVFENHAKKSHFYSTVEIKVKLLSGTFLVKQSSTQPLSMFDHSQFAQKSNDFWLFFFDNFHILCLGKRVRDRREEDLPTKVPFWWITVESRNDQSKTAFFI